MLIFLVVSSVVARIISLVFEIAESNQTQQAPVGSGSGRLFSPTPPFFFTYFLDSAFNIKQQRRISRISRASNQRSASLGRFDSKFRETRDNARLEINREIKNRERERKGKKNERRGGKKKSGENTREIASSWREPPRNHQIACLTSQVCVHSASFPCLLLSIASRAMHSNRCLNADIQIHVARAGCQPAKLSHYSWVYFRNQRVEANPDYHVYPIHPIISTILI